MIRNSNQRWNVGATVRVGFMQGLQVIDSRAVRDYLPDHYLLRRAGAYYRFTPHHGLTRLTATQASGEWWSA